MEFYNTATQNMEDSSSTASASAPASATTLPSPSTVYYDPFFGLMNSVLESNGDKNNTPTNGSNNHNNGHHSHNNSINPHTSMTNISNEIQYMLIGISTLCLLWLTFYTFLVYLQYREPLQTIEGKNNTNDNVELVKKGEQDLRGQSRYRSPQLYPSSSSSNFPGGSSTNNYPHSDNSHTRQQMKQKSNTVYHDQMFHIILMAGLSSSLWSLNEKLR